MDLTFDSFKSDIKTQDAVIRNFEIIGEAGSKISEKYKGLKSNIPWDKIKALRNRLIHDYSGINLDTIWGIIKDDLEDLKSKLLS